VPGGGDEPAAGGAGGRVSAGFVCGLGRDASGGVSRLAVKRAAADARAEARAAPARLKVRPVLQRNIKLIIVILASPERWRLTVIITAVVPRWGSGETSNGRA
jgi:hypothetical protein